VFVPKANYWVFKLDRLESFNYSGMKWVKVGDRGRTQKIRGLRVSGSYRTNG